MCMHEKYPLDYAKKANYATCILSPPPNPSGLGAWERWAHPPTYTPFWVLCSCPPSLADAAPPPQIQDSDFVQSLIQDLRRIMAIDIHFAESNFNRQMSVMQVHVAEGEGHGREGEIVPPPCVQ